MEAAQWAQDPSGSCSKLAGQDQDQERKVRPKNEQALNCPRCHSTNTKFCYYNNYSLTQPRYFCKACKRYWTAGGSLRNIPVGGASRKNKRSSIPTPQSNSKPTLSHFSSNINNSQYPNPNPNNNTHKGQDLNLAFQPSQDQTFHGLSQFLKINSSSHHTSTSLSDLLRNGISSSGLNPAPNPSTPAVPAAAGSDPMYNNTLGFTFQEFNPTMGFAIDHHGNGIKYEGGFHGSSTTQGRLMLPFEALMTRDQGTDHHHHHQSMGKGNSNGYNWNGMLDGGSC